MHNIHNNGLMRKNSSIGKRNRNSRKCVECTILTTINSSIGKRNRNSRKCVKCTILTTINSQLTRQNSNTIGKRNRNLDHWK